MKKITIGLLAAALLSSSLFGKEVSSSNISKIKSNFPFIFNQPGMTVSKSVDHGNLKLIEVKSRGRSFTLFYSQIDNKLLAGTVFNPNGTQVTAPVNIDTIKKGIINTYGTGKKHIYIVTDPECPYCKKLEKNMKKDVLKEFTISTILFPLSFHHESAPMSLYIIAGKTAKERHERMVNIMLHGDKTYKTYKPTKEDRAKLKASVDAASELKASGTPSLYDVNFRKMNYDLLIKK